MWTPKSLLEWTAGWFATKNIPTPRLDAELLLAHVLRLKRLDLYLQFDRPLAAPELASYRELVRKRAERTPVAYLVGEVGFWSLTLDIARGCLIPRPDTETLVEAVVEAITELRGEQRTPREEDAASGTVTSADAEGQVPDWAAIDAVAGSDTPPQDAALDVPNPAPIPPVAAPPSSAAESARPLTVLELGTGSAAIPLAVCSEVRGITWLAADRSREALSVASRNARRHAALLGPRDNRLWLMRANAFAGVRADTSIDLIISNPPYIRSAEIDGLMPEVSVHEPRAALDGGTDGLDFYRLLIDEAGRRLRSGGLLIVEIGHDQQPGIAVLVAAAGLEIARVRKDLAGHTRVLEIRKARPHWI